MYVNKKNARKRKQEEKEHVADMRGEERYEKGRGRKRRKSGGERIKGKEWVERRGQGEREGGEERAGGERK